MTGIESSSEELKGSRVKLSRKKQAFFAILVFIVFLLALEGLLRLLGVGPAGTTLPTGNGLYQRANNSVGFKYTPGWEGIHAGARVHINSAGWRGKEFSQIKPPGTFRILGVGDSFTFGKAVDDEDVFLAQLERMLNSGGGPRYEALNAGHEGINTATELQYFNECEMTKLAPDVVILGFTVSNDAELTPNRRAYRERRRNSTLSLRITESDWFSALSEKSRLAALLARGAEWASSQELSKINAEVILSNYEDGSESWESCRRALMGFYEVCHQHKVPFILVLFPDCSSDLNEPFRDYPEDFIKVHAKINDVFSGKNGAIVVDILDDLAVTTLTARETMVPVDGHPNAMWHELVACRLQRTIKELQLQH